MFNLAKAAILGVIQGVTEFLPVSSTAHLLIGERLLGFDDPGGIFTIMIQLGSILAVVWLYRAKLVDDPDGAAVAARGAPVRVQDRAGDGPDADRRRALLEVRQDGSLRQPPRDGGGVHHRRHRDAGRRTDAPAARRVRRGQPARRASARPSARGRRWR